MSALREAAQQSLEAWQRWLRGECPQWKLVMRFAELEAAVAQQAEPVVQGQTIDDAMRETREKAQAYEAGWNAALARQIEPVAWRCSCGANLYIDEYGHPASRAAPRYGKPQQAEPVERGE